MKKTAFILICLFLPGLSYALELPVGVTRITEPITDKEIIGQGSHRTVLIADNTDAIIVHGSDVVIRGMTILTNTTGKTGITVTGIGTITGKGPMIDDIVLLGENVWENWWYAGVHLQEAWYATIRDVHVTGHPHNWDVATFGIVSTGETVDVLIDRCSGIWVANGVAVYNHAEGWRVVNGTWITQSFGIAFVLEGVQPHFIATGNHVNSRCIGIYNNGQGAQVTDNNIFVSRKYSNAHGIWLTGGHPVKGIVTGNVIIVTDTGNSAYGIVLQGQNAFLDNNSITGFHAPLTREVFR